MIKDAKAELDKKLSDSEFLYKKLISEFELKKTEKLNKLEEFK